ncbi:MAG: F0F1 ATP synthase subunit A [Mollicutes bacterium PWAP]|nr:F0F1 ATP synthase subunit A [Mollicutes bacterium PWAP]
MDKFANSFLFKKHYEPDAMNPDGSKGAWVTGGQLQPQIFSLMLVTIILVIVSIYIYLKLRKTKVNKAPTGIVLLTEQYVMAVDNLYVQATGNKIRKPAPYIFTLMTFLVVGNLFGLIGLEPPGSSFSVTLTIGLITWIGIYVVGIMYQKAIFFKKFVNPTELIGQFSPLISISFRLFGNLVGGGTIMFLIYAVTGIIWKNVPYIGEINLLGAIIAPVFHAYFDMFDGLIQAFVFVLLTMIYWSLEVEEEFSKEQSNNNKIKKTKKSNKKEGNNNTVIA